MCYQPGKDDVGLYKIIRLYELLSKYSDEDHVLSMDDIICKLDSLYEIKIERKAVYRYLKALCDMGYDISMYDDNRKGYFLRQREFELTELRIMVDAILSSRFISMKKTKRLVEKIKGLASEYDGRKLDRMNFISDRIKSDNEEIYYDLDRIDAAIIDNRKISFLYYDYDASKELVARRRGERYVVNPYATVWVNDYYYLIGNYDKYDNLSHYRLDRMRKVAMLDEPRKNPKDVEGMEKGFNVGEYVKNAIYMFTGEPEKVGMRFDNSMMNNVFDRFGKNVLILKDDAEHFRIVVDAVPEGLIYWALQFGEWCEVISPEWLRDEMKERLSAICGRYGIR